MKKFSYFAPMAKAYLESDKAPKSIKFTGSGTMQTSVEGLANAAAIECKDYLGNKTINQHVADYEQMTRDRLHNGEMLAPFDDLANKFARTIHDGIKNLRTIKKDVQDLVAKTMSNYQDLIAMDPVLTAYTGEGNTDSLSMESINWNIMKDVSERRVVYTVHDRTGYPADGEVNASTVQLAINNLRQTYTEDSFKAAPALTKEKVDRIVDGIINSVATTCTRDEVVNAVKSALFMNYAVYHQTVNNLAAFAAGNTVANINNVMKFVANTKAINKYITEDILDLGAVTRKQVVSNIEAIDALADAAAYICINYRNSIWKDALVTPGPLVNPDNMDAFKEQGGTVAKLVQMYNYTFKETGAPVSGVSLHYAVDTMARAEEVYKADIARNAAICEQKKQECLRNAFIQTSLEYLNEHRSMFSKQFNETNLPKFTSAIYDSVQLDVPLESRYYDLILNSCYINSIERNLYTRLNNAYVKHAASTETLTAEMCDRIDVRVYADVISEYLIDKGILIVE